MIFKVLIKSVPTLPAQIILECKSVSKCVRHTTQQTDAFHSTANSPKKNIKIYRHILKLNVQCATV